MISRTTCVVIAILLVLTCLGRAGAHRRQANIHDAARTGDLATVRALVTATPSLVGARDENGRTPLHWAARGVHQDVLAFLVDHGADVNAADHNAVVPLHSVAARDHGEAVAILVGKGARVDLPNQLAQTALHLAAQAGAPRSVAALLRARAAIDPKDSYGRTPLVLGAREAGHLEVIRLLLDAGAGIDIVDRFGSSALELAAWRGRRELVDLLLDRGAAIPAHGERAAEVLSYTAERGLDRLFRAMVAGGVSLTTANSRGGTLLHDAAAGGSAAIVAALIDARLDVNGRDRYGWTPLHHAARDGRSDAVRTLLARGADRDARTLMGQSALNIADEGGLADVRRILSDAGADQSPIRFPDLRGDYLGEAPPGFEPRLFARGIISSIWSLHSTAVFSPDGSEVYWAPMVVKPGAAYSTGGLVMMRRVNGRWTPPVAAPFTSEARDDVPFFGSDGRRLYFLSTRRLPGATSGGENIWVVERTPAGWSAPQPFDPVVNSRQKHWQFSIDRAGHVYFASSAAGGHGLDDLYVSRLVNGRYQPAENLGPAVNSAASEGTPFIAPDGSYLLLNRDQDLHISFRRPDGTWSEARTFGAPINTPASELCPMVTADGRYLFFNSARDGQLSVYWVDARIIERLRPPR